MRVVFFRGLAVVGVLGLALSAPVARGQEAALLPRDLQVLEMGREEVFDRQDLLLARCVAELDPEAPPKKAPGKVIVIPDATTGKKVVEKEKVTVRPTPMPMEGEVEEDYGCADDEGCGGCCHSCCCRPRDPFYVALSGGWAHRETVHEVGDPSTFIIFNEGFAANVAIGWRFCGMFRLEGEYSFMNNDVETAGSAGLSSESTGNVNLRAWMLNLYHDIQICDWNLRPYVGAGIGFYQSELNSLYPAFFDVVGPPMAGVGLNATSDITFAYQFRAGFSYPLGCRGEIYTGYRYFNGDELTFSAPPFSAFAPSFHPDGAEMHCLEMGVRIGF
jgi:opacity protein-like surface antigen